MIWAASIGSHVAFSFCPMGEASHYIPNGHNGNSTCMEESATVSLVELSGHCVEKVEEKRGIRKKECVQIERAALTPFCFTQRCHSLCPTTFIENQIMTLYHHDNERGYLASFE